MYYLTGLRDQKGNQKPNNEETHRQDLEAVARRSHGVLSERKRCGGNDRPCRSTPFWLVHSLGAWRVLVALSFTRPPPPPKCIRGVAPLEIQKCQ